MTDFDFYDALSRRREFYAFAKEASAGEAVKNFALNPATIGALAGVGIQYLANRKGASGKSFQRKAYERAAVRAKRDLSDAEKEGFEPSALTKSRAVTAPALARLSEIAEEHPFVTALPAAGIGAGVAAGIAAALK